MSDDALLRTMIEIEAEACSYVSCNPGTLARNLRVLKDLHDRY